MARSSREEGKGKRHKAAPDKVPRGTGAFPGACVVSQIDSHVRVNASPGSDWCVDMRHCVMRMPIMYCCAILAVLRKIR